MTKIERQIRALAAHGLSGRQIAHEIGKEERDVQSMMRLLSIKRTTKTEIEAREKEQRQAARKAAGEARRQAAEQRRQYREEHGKRLYRKPQYHKIPALFGAHNPFGIGAQA